MIRIVLVILSLLLYARHSVASSSLLASEFTESAFDLGSARSTEKDKYWHLGLEVGATVTSGNTDTQSYKTKVSGALFRSLWRLQYFAQLLQQSDNGQRNVSKLKGGAKANWDFSPVNSSFATIEYEKSKFATYESLTTVAAGYTHRFYYQNNIMWDADIGPGLRWTSRQTESDRDMLSVLHLGTLLMFPLSNHADFEQVVVSDLGLTGNKSKVIRSESAVTASVLDSLKMKLSYTLRHDSVPDAGRAKLDTLTSVTLLMTF